MFNRIMEIGGSFMRCHCFDNNGENCIEKVPIFDNLSDDEMVEIAKIAQRKEFAKDEMIYMAGDLGDKLYVVNSGKIKVSRISDTGKEQVIRVLGTGDFMGELALFNRSELRDNAIALSDVVMCVISADEMKESMRKYPDISIKIMEELSNRLEDVETLIENISIHGVERRIADSLIGLSDERGEINLKMSRKDLASHLGMSQETLSRKLRSFEETGLIKLVGHRKIRILDMEAIGEIK